MAKFSNFSYSHDFFQFKMPSNHLAVNVMMDMRVMVMFVMKWTNVPEEFIIVIPWPLVLMRVQHSDASVDPVMMVLAHIAVISMNVIRSM